MIEDEGQGQALDGIDEAKRKSIGRLVKGGAFLAPIVATFAMQGLTIRPAMAGNSSFSSNSTISDIRLKRDIARVGTHALGFGTYRYRYLWSDRTYIGVMAQEVLQHVPGAVASGASGLLRVDYGRLGMQLTEVASV